MSAMARRRQNAALDQLAEFGHQSFRPRPQRGVYCHDLSAPRRAVKQRTLGHGQADHFLDAHRLCAELHAIGIMRLRRTPFVLDWEGLLAATFGAQPSPTSDALVLGFEIGQ